MAASPQLVYTTNYVTYVQIDVVLRFSVYACPFGTHRLAAGKGFGNGVVQWFGPSTVAVAIMCVELPSFLLYYCRHFFQIVGAKLPRCIAHLGCGRRLDHMYTRHHIRPCTFIPASTRDRGAFGRRAHRYSSWNRRGKPDLLRQNKGAAGRSSSSYYLRAICSTGAFTILARPYRDYRRSRIKHERETPSYPLNRCQKQLLWRRTRSLELAGENAGGVGILDTARDVGLEPTQMTLYSAANLRLSHCERVSKCSSRGLIELY